MLPRSSSSNSRQQEASKKKTRALALAPPLAVVVRCLNSSAPGSGVHCATVCVCVCVKPRRRARGKPGFATERAFSQSTGGPIRSKGRALPLKAPAQSMHPISGLLRLLRDSLARRLGPESMMMPPLWHWHAPCPDHSLTHSINPHHTQEEEEEQAAAAAAGVRPPPRLDRTDQPSKAAAVKNQTRAWGPSTPSSTRPRPSTR